MKRRFRLRINKPENIVDKDIKDREKMLYRLQIVGAIISALSILFMALTLSEMRSQRQSSYKPIISIANSELMTENYRPENEYNCVDVFGYQFEPEVFPEALSKMKPYTLKLENVGLGTARNVEVAWDKANFKKYCEYMDQHLDSYDNRTLSFDEDGDLKLISVNYIDEPLLKEEISKDVYTPFLKPVETGDTFEVDATFFSHLMAFSEFARTSEKKPEIRLNVSYEDIYSKQYKTSILLNYELQNSINDETGDINMLIKTLPELEYL